MPETSKEYGDLSVVELRKLANERGLGSSGWRATANKAALVDALTSGLAPTDSSINELSSVISAALMNHIESKAVSAEKVRQIVAEELEARLPRRLVVSITGRQDVELTDDHFAMPDLLGLVSNRVNVYMVGPAGSGKTTAARRVSEILGLQLYALSVGPQTSEAKLMGFHNASGDYVETPVKMAYANGGVLLIDEIDAASPGVLTCINGITSSTHVRFGAEDIQRHEDFVCIAAANTFGNGGSRVYVGRNQLDAATLDRFAFLDWPYDLKLERRLASNEAWVNYIEKVRKGLDDLRIRHVVSPRASILGATMLAAGMPEAKVRQLFVFKGMAEDDRAKLMTRLREIGD